MKHVDELCEENIRLRVIGRREGLPIYVVKTIYKVEEKTKKNTKFQFNIAFNYGGRAEIIDVISIE